MVGRRALVLPRRGPGAGLELTNCVYSVLTACGVLHDAIPGRPEVSEARLASTAAASELGVLLSGNARCWTRWDSTWRFMPCQLSDLSRARSKGSMPNRRGSAVTSPRTTERLPAAGRPAEYWVTGKRGCAGALVRSSRRRRSPGRSPHTAHPSSTRPLAGSARRPALPSRRGPGRLPAWGDIGWGALGGAGQHRGQQQS
jgi:hypothetical protein